MKMISGYLGQDLQVEGNLHTNESIRIDGVYIGNIVSDQEVNVGVSGKVKGGIEAPVIRVSGWVKGDLKASKLLEVLGEARIKGNLRAPAGGLSMGLGGQFEGQFVITENATDEPQQAKLA